MASLEGYWLIYSCLFDSLLHPSLIVLSQNSQLVMFFKDSPLSTNREPIAMTGKGVGKGASNWLRLKRIYSKAVSRLSRLNGREEMVTLTEMVIHTPRSANAFHFSMKSTNTFSTRVPLWLRLFDKHLHFIVGTINNSASLVRSYFCHSRCQAQWSIFGTARI